MATDVSSQAQPPHFSIVLSHLDREKTIEQAKQIVLQLRPQWSEQATDDGIDGLEHEYFTNGITNTILSLWNKKAGGTKNRVLLRIYGEKTELIIDRHAEKRNMALLNRYGCAAPLYGTFENGVIYGYVPGRVLDLEDVRDPHLAELIAKQLAKMHTVGSDDSDNCTVTVDGEREVIPREPVLLPKLSAYIENMPTHFDDAGKQAKFAAEFPSKQELLVELESIRQKVEALRSPVVFCHNDLLIKNLIHDKEKDAINFIDYEYADYNFQAFDIGDHFCEYAGVETVDFSLYPDEQYQKWWLRNYLKYWHEFTKRSPPTDRDVDVLYIQVNAFAAMAHFWWSIWAIIQARYSTIDFDFLQYGIDRMNEYKKLKQRSWDWTIDQ